MAILEVENLTCRLRDREEPVLSGISFSVEPGDFLILAGANGSGKTVLMKHLNGLIKADEGRVLFRGKEIHRQLSLVRRRVGLVFQNPDHQMVGQTVMEEVAFGPENLGWPLKEIQEKSGAALKDFDLIPLARSSPYDLSGGEKKRVSLAAVMVMEPDILILDEPFTGLDWPSVQKLLTHLRTIHQRGTAIFLITHDLQKCLAHASRLLLLKKGRMLPEQPLPPGDTPLPADGLASLKEAGIRPPSGAPPQPRRSMTWLI